MAGFVSDVDPQEFLDQYELIHTSTDQKGYARIKKKDKFIFLDTKGQEIQSEKTLKRIAALVLPPAWTDVWICSKSNGHLQATGIDDRGRKQYRYHKKWEEIRNETKFNQLYYFGKKLGKLRTQLSKDLRKRTLNKEKVTALALSIMEVTLLRVGNASYEKEYGSHGLTTLKNRHIKFEKGQAFFKFKGKKGVKHNVEMKGPSLVRLLKKVKELPGQEVFQYYDEHKELNSLDSSDINAYLKEHMEGNFTCKDFRTWAGCVSAIECMLQNTCDEDVTKTEMKKTTISVIDFVAGKLGNTRTVCKKYYIHPQLLSSFEHGELSSIIPISKSKTINSQSIEKAFLSFLKKEIS